MSMLCERKERSGKYKENKKNESTKEVGKIRWLSETAGKGE